MSYNKESTITGTFKASLKERFVHDEISKLYDEFLKCLKESGGIIAGGFVCNSLTGIIDIQCDIDIYVPNPEHGVRIPLLDFLLKNGTVERATCASPYDKSFLRKNGIAVRLPFELGIGYRYGIQIDLMVLQPGRMPKAATSSFDLTCCEVWYDPALDLVEGTHLELTLSKKAFLRKEYNIAFIGGNPFTRRRIDKYIKRGFIISFEETPQIVGYAKNHNAKVLLTDPETMYVIGMIGELFNALRFYNGPMSLASSKDKYLQGFRFLKSALLFDNVEVLYRPSLDGFIRLMKRIEEIIGLKNLGKHIIVKSMMCKYPHVSLEYFRGYYDFEKGDYVAIPEDVEVFRKAGFNFPDYDTTTGQEMDDFLDEHIPIPTIYKRGYKESIYKQEKAIEKTWRSLRWFKG